jgi:hypothetical protein
VDINGNTLFSQVLARYTRNNVLPERNIKICNIPIRNSGVAGIARNRLIVFVKKQLIIHAAKLEQTVFFHYDKNHGIEGRGEIMQARFFKV